MTHGKHAPGAETASAVMTLDQYDKNKHNVLMPTQAVGRIAQWHNVRVTLVQANISDEGGEIYKVGSKKVGNDWVDLVSPAKPLLFKLASAAGIIWVPHEHKVASVERDPVTKQKIAVRFETVGLLRLPDGSWQPIKGTKEIDLMVIEQELRKGAADKVDAGLYWNDGKKWANMPGVRRVEEKDPESRAGTTTRFYVDNEDTRQMIISSIVEPAMIQWHKSIVQRAETGAMLRVIRAALGMKMQYTKDELAKPFVVPRVEWAPDLSDPDVKRMVLAQGVGAMSGLFTQLPAMSQTSQAAVPGVAPGEQVREVLDGGPDDEYDDEAARRELEEANGATRSGGGQAAPVEAELVAPVPGSPAAKAAQPWAEQEQPPKPQPKVCGDCGGPIIEHEQKKAGGTTQHWKAEDVARATMEAFGVELCWQCAGERSKPKPSGVGQPVQRGGR
jgi:hypothetical protein